MGEQLKQRDSFDFQNLDTGLYRLKCKETDIVDMDKDTVQKAKVPNDYTYVINFNVQGGENDGGLHIERCAHISQGHMGISKLMMCAWKMEIIPAPPHDSEKFDRERFKEKFMMQFPGREVWVIIKNNPKTGFSNIVSFYHVNELKQAQEEYNKKYVKTGQPGPHEVKKDIGPLPGSAATSPAQSQKQGLGKDDW